MVLALARIVCAHGPLGRRPLTRQTVTWPQPPVPIRNIACPFRWVELTALPVIKNEILYCSSYIVFWVKNQTDLKTLFLTKFYKNLITGIYICNRNKKKNIFSRVCFLNEILDWITLICLLEKHDFILNHIYFIEMRRNMLWCVNCTGFAEEMYRLQLKWEAKQRENLLRPKGDATASTPKQRNNLLGYI